MFRYLILVSMLSVVTLVSAVASTSAAPNAGNLTLRNLQAAYNGECNTHARYIAFASKADAEGYKGIASLFRAAAEAEKVHSELIADVLQSLGVKPETRIEQVKTGSTKENLEAAYQAEMDARDNIYSVDVTQAKADSDRQATQVFGYVQAVESNHAQLYHDALENMGKWKAAREFAVCPKCGNTVESLDFKVCQVCATPSAQFVKVK